MSVLLGVSSIVWLLSSPQALAQQVNDADDAVEVGQWRYEVSCKTCHGENGEGIQAFGNPLRGNPIVQSAPEQALIDIIQNGRYNREKAYPEYSGMPAFHYIRGSEARALVAYLKGGLQEQE